MSDAELAELSGGACLPPPRGRIRPREACRQPGRCVAGCGALHLLHQEARRRGHQAHATRGPLGEGKRALVISGLRAPLSLIVIAAIVIAVTVVIAAVITDNISIIVIAIITLIIIVILIVTIVL